MLDIKTDEFRRNLVLRLEFELECHTTWPCFVRLQTPEQRYSDSVTATIDQLEAQALALTEGQRAELAERLVESLARPGHGTSEEAWLALAKQRRDELRSGQVMGIPGEAGSALVRRLVGR